jgi:hypothetical protein
MKKTSDELLLERIQIMADRRMKTLLNNARSVTVEMACREAYKQGLTDMASAIIDENKIRTR